MVLAEDTRQTQKLLRRYDIETRLLSCHDHNEAERARQALDLWRTGRTIVLVSDAGTPGLSDPGYRVVRAAIEAGVRVTALPGPSALLPALTSAGLPIDTFVFLGFLPRRVGPRDRALSAALALPHTFAFYESPHRLAASLAAMVRLGAGERPAAVARELTKVHEEVRRGSVVALSAHFADRQPRGEFVVVISRA